MVDTEQYMADVPNDKAKEEHESFFKDNDTLNSLRSYTDRSGIENQIGVAA